MEMVCSYILRWTRYRINEITFNNNSTGVEIDIYNGFQDPKTDFLLEDCYNGDSVWIAKSAHGHSHLFLANINASEMTILTRNDTTSLVISDRRV